MEAQKYPDDFDAIVAGAPANYQTHLHAWDMMVATTIRKDDQHFVSAPKLAALNKAVMAACDAADGVKDGLLNDPRKCKFDPGYALMQERRGQRRLPDPGAARIRQAGVFAG